MDSSCSRNKAAEDSVLYRLFRRLGWKVAPSCVVALAQSAESAVDPARHVPVHVHARTLLKRWKASVMGGDEVWHPAAEVCQHSLHRGSAKAARTWKCLPSTGRPRHGGLDLVGLDVGRKAWTSSRRACTSCSVMGFLEGQAVDSWSESR